VRLRSADTVEKVAERLFQFSCVKIDLSDRPTTRARTLVKGKKTPENLTTETASDFFNSIGHILPFSERTTLPLERLQYSGTCRASCVNSSANAAVCAGTFVAHLSP
jgi:hypothetical protein